MGEGGKTKKFPMLERKKCEGMGEVLRWVPHLPILSYMEGMKREK